MGKSNKTARVFVGLGVAIMIVSVLIGTAIAPTEIRIGAIDRTEFSWGVFFTTAFSGFISGMFFIGMAEIIELLDGLNWYGSKVSSDLRKLLNEKNRNS
ncbi:hypothetical protein [Pseudogracilibacillus sp. ICA-222130]|uniref:hypothetical protein n=1 Tax=Pseudogracilibacillus sp. ICA-222130 TaxID=3134655 RepID=UPI0030C5A6D8